MTSLPGEVKGFKDLEQEVQKAGICGKCGGCVAFCSAGEFHALRSEADGTPVMADESKCLHCGICYLICPQIRALDQELREKLDWKQPIGPVRRMASARASSQRILRVATDGGVVTALLTFALKKKMIDGAIVSRPVGPFSREPAIATDAESLLQAAGSHFEESLHVHAVGGMYSSFSPSIKEVKSLGQHGMRKIALVGTPCQVFTMQKMRLLQVLPADSIKLIIGLFCMQNFSFNAKARRALEKRMSVKLSSIDKLNIKDDVIVTTRKKDVIHIPFEEMDTFARPACFACSDFSNEYADISCGGLGSPDGYTSTILRTAEGERLYNLAKREGIIKELGLRGRKARQDHYTEMMAKIVSFSRRKQVRAAKTLREAGRGA
ncbi:MAG: Coenzyme F420 hydrogenase/dehydrogenase, beta subunit C-terminal domain [Deltaproteobacteria bacterium]|nr:Coenzyme F420 hydrogenase/dehydrogenase, beta subunit C-terminal domain [Deltaproteobacteria bacterium]